MLEIIIECRYILITIFLLLLVIVEIVIHNNKKIKPIDMDKVLEEKKEKSKIEEVLEAMESSSSDRPMTTFEQEQEANAIISYQELVKAVNEKKDNSEFKEDKENVEVKETPVEPKIEELLSNAEENEFEESLEETIEDKIDKEEANLDKPKFKNSEFISPIFGKEESTNDDFLKELKDLRKNL